MGPPEIANIEQETLKRLALQKAPIVTGPFHKTFKGVWGSSKPIDVFF